MPAAIDCKAALHRIFREVAFGRSAEDATATALGRFAVSAEILGDAEELCAQHGSMLGQAGIDGGLHRLAAAMRAASWFLVRGSDCAGTMQRGVAPGTATADLLSNISIWRLLADASDLAAMLDLVPSLDLSPACTELAGGPTRKRLPGVDGKEAKYDVFSRDPPAIDLEDGQILRATRKYTHLGVVVTDTAASHPEVAHRNAAGRQAYSAMGSAILANPQIAVDVKCRVAAACIICTQFWGAGA